MITKSKWPNDSLLKNAEVFEYFVVNLSVLLCRRPPKTGRAVLVFIIVYCTFDSEQ